MNFRKTSDTASIILNPAEPCYNYFVMKTLLLIDASALIYRFFHALPPLTTPQDEPIQAIYGLTNVLLKILREQKPDYAAAALDRPEKTFRKEQFEQYKIHRPPAPDALISQIKRAPDIFALLSIPTFSEPGFEADDVIGTLAEHFAAETELKIVILSGDLDMLQLVRGEKIIAQIIKSGVANTDFYNESAVVERYGLAPAQLPDYKGLIGDTSDNIPGVKGIGQKTASELLKEFPTLEEIFENTAIINPTASKKLEGKREEALLWKKLATIDRRVPFQMPALEALAMKPLDKASIIQEFQKLGFTSLIGRLE